MRLGQTSMTPGTSAALNASLFSGNSAYVPNSGAASVGARAIGADVASLHQANAMRSAASAAEAMPGFDPTAQAMDPIWLRNDCNCRGGTFVEVPGAPQSNFCIPPLVPTGKRFDLQTRGCVPIPGYTPPSGVGFCSWNGHNICLYGLIAAGVFAVLTVATGKKGGGSKRRSRRRSRR